MRYELKPGDLCWHISGGEDGACSQPRESRFIDDGRVEWLDAACEMPVEKLDLLIRDKGEAWQTFGRVSRSYLNRKLGDLQDYARMMKVGGAISEEGYRVIDDSIDVARDGIDQWPSDSRSPQGGT